MGQGNLRVNVMEEQGLSSIQGARVVLRDGENRVLYDALTDTTGTVPLMSLSAPDVALTLDPGYAGMPFAVYNMEVSAPGFHTMIYHGIEVFADTTATQPVLMHRASRDEIARGETTRHVVITGTRRQQMQGQGLDLIEQTIETVG